MKNILITVLIIFVPIITVAQAPVKISWMTIEEAVKLQEENPKTILIDMYTDWCGWCKKMDIETFDNPNIANYINTNFYPVKFNAESLDTVVYRGQAYTNVNIAKNTGNKAHQLAEFLMNGRMSFPTIVYIDYEFNINPVPGFLSAKDIEPILVYFTERVNKNVDFPQFLQDFKNTFDPDSTAKTGGNVNWLTLEEASEQNKEKNKKTLLFINSDFNNSSKLMLASVFRHPVISNYINEYFLPVKFNYDNQDTVTFGGRTFINEQKIQGYPNQFVLALLQPDIRLPSTVFLDEEQKIIFILRGYFSPQVLERYMNFIGNDLYKINTDWLKFNEDFKSKLDE